MGRRSILVVAIVVLMVGALTAAPFVAEIPSSRRAPADESDAEDATAPALQAEPAKREQSLPRRRARDEYAEFRRYLDDRRAAGKPTTLRELLGPDPPDADNAAVEIEAALDAVYAECGEEATWPPGGGWSLTQVTELSPEQLEQLRTFVTRFRPFLDRVASALDRPRCRFPVPETLDDLWDRVGRPLTRAREILLALAGEDTDVQRRLDAVSCLLRLARRNEPSTGLTSTLNRSFAWHAIAKLRDGIERSEFDPGVARLRFDGLLTTDWPTTGPALFELELVGGITVARKWIDGELEVPSGAGELFRFELPSSQDLVATAVLHEEAGLLPPTPHSTYSDRADAIDTRAKKDGHYVGASMKVYWLLETEAACRLARVALAAADCRATHGDFPASLDELRSMFPNGVPLNPMTDAPFVYEKSASGVRIATDAYEADVPDLEQMRRDKCRVWELKR